QRDRHLPVGARLASRHDPVDLEAASVLLEQLSGLQQPLADERLGVDARPEAVARWIVQPVPLQMIRLRRAGVESHVEPDLNDAVGGILQARDDLIESGDVVRAPGVQTPPQSYQKRS